MQPLHNNVITSKDRVNMKWEAEDRSRRDCLLFVIC